MKHTNSKLLSNLIILSMILFNISCRKKYDEPPITQIPEGNIISIADLKAMYTGSDLSINEDYNIYANVTTEETASAENLEPVAANVEETTTEENPIDKDLGL